MTPSYSLIMVRRWGLICLVGILAALSSSFASFAGVHAPIHEGSNSGKRLIDEKLSLDKGTNASAYGGSRQSASLPAIATPTPETEATSRAPGEDDAAERTETQASEDTGDIIRKRVFTAILTAAAITAGLLLLLWAYVTLGDPFRRRRAAMRIRQERREERKSRLRRRRRQ